MNFWDDIADRYKDEQGGMNWQNLMGDAGQFAYKNGYENQGAWSAAGKAIDAGNNPRSDTPEPPKVQAPNPYRQASEIGQMSAPQPQTPMSGGTDTSAVGDNAKMAMAGLNQKPQFKDVEPYKPDNILGTLVSLFLA